MREVVTQGIRARVLSSIVAALLASAAWCGLASAEDAPPPPPLEAPLERLFDPAQQALQKSNLPLFIRDTDLRVHFRSYYFNRTKPDE